MKSKKPCPKCFNARFDPELTDENDFYSSTVGSCVGGYRIMFNSGCGKPINLEFSVWNQQIEEWQVVGLFYLPHCPFCGRKIVEYG